MFMRQARASLLAALMLSSVAMAVGPSFSEPVKVYQTAKNFAEPSIRVAPNGHIFVATFEDDDADPVQGSRPFRAFRSDNNGTTWVDISPPKDPSILQGGDVDLAVDPCGRLYAVAAITSTSSLAIYESGDEGQTWLGHLVNIITNGTVDRPWLTTGGCGQVYFNFVITAGPGPLNSMGFLRRDPSTGRWFQGATIPVWEPVIGTHFR